MVLLQGTVVIRGILELVLFGNTAACYMDHGNRKEAKHLISLFAYIYHALLSGTLHPYAITKLICLILRIYDQRNFF